MWSANSAISIFANWSLTKIVIFFIVSEEEIDVETVYGDSKKPNSRSSSSGGVLPTNPSFSDRQQLQLTVASAINKKEVKKPSARTSTVPPRYSLDDRTLKPKVVACKRKNSVRNSEIRRTGSCNKRSAQFDDYECVTKSVKRKKYQYQRHFKSGKTKKSKSRRNHVRNSGGSSESEEDSCQKRTMHNSMERQRRIDLRNAFEELRKLVPHTADNEKAAKVVILSSGAEFCQSLTQEEAELTRKRAELRRQQEMLRAKVSQLRRSLAVERSSMILKK